MARSEREIRRLWEGLAQENGVRQGAAYLGRQFDRLYATYRTVVPHVDRNSRAISVGGGIGYVECALRDETGCSVTILDFPEAIEAHASYYATVGFTGLGVNLANGATITGDYTLLLSSEVVEHVPEPPSEQLRRVRGALARDADVFITTPNAACLKNIVKVALGRPILMEPERTFAPVSYENEGIHRREYMPVEIERAMRANNIVPVRRTYCRYGWERPPQRLVGIVPRFRECMILHGRAS